MRIPPKHDVRRPGASASSTSSATAVEKAPPLPPGLLGVDIAELEARYGWKTGGWQDTLLRAADTAGQQDGKVSVAEVDAYLAKPEDLQFLTSSRLLQQKQQVGGAGERQAVDSFESGWQRNLASQADLAGTQDGFVTSEELASYTTRLKAGRTGGSSWMPEQKAAVLDSKIAELTGEVDHLRPAGGAPQGSQLAKEYMRVATNDVTRSPDWVSYVVTAADRAIQDNVPRDGLRFKTDPLQPAESVTQDEYTGLNTNRLPQDKTTFDRGHMREAESSVDAESMVESFLTSNVAPQYKNVNQGAWRYLEEAVMQLTEASGGKATVLTGNLYLDGEGRPLPMDEVSRRKTKQDKTLGIPTHCYKAVLLEQPDGSKKAYAFIIPNRPDIGTKLKDVTERLRAEQWRVDVDTLESLTGYDFFSQLNAEEQARLESDSTSHATFLDPKRDKLATLFLGE